MEKTPCLFCDILARRSPEIHFATKCFFAFTPLYPINAGHILIVPRRHIVDLFSLNAKESRGFRRALAEGKAFLEERFHPDGYNLGVNSGEAAGQTVFHLHFHLIPRFKEDVPDPYGGIVRNLLQGYTKSPRPPWLPKLDGS